MASLTTALAVLQALAIARVPVAAPGDLERLARLGFEVASVEVDPGGIERAIVVVSAETRQLLFAAGFVPEDTPVRSAAAPAVPVNFFDFDAPTTGIRRQLADLAVSRPHVHLDSIGASIEGRPILAVKIGPADDAPSRPNVLFIATHHAREWVSTTMAMHLVRYLADSLSPSLRDARDVWVVPVANPDGYQFSFDGERLWRKNRRLNADGSVGVDLNRNYPAFWGRDEVGSSSNPAAETYRGMGPASEPEVAALMAFHRLHPPVLSVSYHTYTGLVIHPYGFTPGAFAPDAPVFRALAGTLLAPAVHDELPQSSREKYHPGPAWNLYPVNGEYSDWVYRSTGTIAFTVELTSGCCIDGNWYGFLFPDDGDLLARVHADNLPFALAVISEAGDPARATGPSGLTTVQTRFEALWPEVHLVDRHVGPVLRRVTVKRNGVTASTLLAADSLDTGVYYTVFRGARDSGTPRVVTTAGDGVRAEVLGYAGAEPGEDGWSGWSVSSDALVGVGSWRSNGDTLVSPIFDAEGRHDLWLQLWMKHAGSVYLPSRRGLVQYSDGGAWHEVAEVAGHAPVWYPVRFDLPPGLTGQLRFRFVSFEMDWWIDGFALASDEAPSLGDLRLAASDSLVVSDNPVLGDVVTVAWPPATAEVELSIYTFAGELVVTTRLAAGAEQYEWDLTTASGARIRDGGYAVVVRTGSTVYRRRLFVARGR